MALVDNIETGRMWLEALNNDLEYLNSQEDQDDFEIMKLEVEIEMMTDFLTNMERDLEEESS
jgi:hypothetical protein